MIIYKELNVFSLRKKNNFSCLPKSSLRVPLGSIEIFSRHCLHSSISGHKKRLDEFSRKKCYLNFLATLPSQKVNVTYFLDVAQGKREDHFLDQSSQVVEFQGGSETSSFLYVLNYAERMKMDPETILYFVEDDYLHREGWVDILLEGFQLPGIDYVTLYDHQDKYFSPSYDTLESKIFASPSCHWRTTPSTTNTFAVRYKTLMKHLAIHRKFSEGRVISADHDKFCYLKKKGATLISSIPGWSTHADLEFTSPCFDWNKLLNNTFIGAL